MSNETNATDYRSMVNPTFLTAKSTVFMLAGAGNHDAKRMIANLGLYDALSSSKKGESPYSEQDANALMTGITTAVENRYAALSRILINEGYKALLDIACGYTPRSIFCSRNGIRYAGLDVPVVAEELQRAADKEGLGKVYTGGDATNAATLLAASDSMTGEVLVSTEGLWGYLFKEEFEQLAAGIRQVLKKHGGAWVSSDMGVDYATFATVNMSSNEAVELYHASRRKTMSDANIYNDGVGYWETDKVRELLESCGLKVEVLPFYHGDEDLNILKNLPDEWKKKLLAILETSHIWKMTLDEGYTEKGMISGAKQVENLKIDYEIKGREMICTVKGRIDTISAPALLEVFDKNYDAVNSIVIHAEKLEYISSAGLRVLLMAMKKLGEGTVRVTGASSAVKDIFETTGFDQMIIVE